MFEFLKRKKRRRDFRMECVYAGPEEMAKRNGQSFNKADQTEKPAEIPAPAMAGNAVQKAPAVQEAPAAEAYEQESPAADIEAELKAVAEKPVSLQAKIHIYNAFAGGYFYQRNYQAAQKFLEEALKIDPLDGESLRNMAVLCHEQGEKEKAQEFAAKLPQTDFLLLSALR